MTDPNGQIDAALLALRHMWSAPPHVRDPKLGPVDSSSVQIVTVLADRPGATIAQLAQAIDVAPSTASRLVARSRDRRPRAPRGGVDDAAGRPASDSTGRTLARRSGGSGPPTWLQLTRDWSPADRRHFAHLLQRFAHAVTQQPPSRTAEPNSHRDPAPTHPTLLEDPRDRPHHRRYRRHRNEPAVALVRTCSTGRDRAGTGPRPSKLGNLVDRVAVVTGASTDPAALTELVQAPIP